VLLCLLGVFRCSMGRVVYIRYNISALAMIICLLSYDLNASHMLQASRVPSSVISVYSCGSRVGV